jgi:multidrug efflux pump subunit AcrB
VIAATIPLSLAFAVITLHLLGRSLNTISLAGLAFSTGIVTDAALIVQGNIIRFMQEGRSALQATIDGAGEVIPALFASMLTSVAIFLPVLFMQGLEGQLFKDLAITMSVSHAASLLVAMTVIPAANRWALARKIPDDQHDHWWKAMARGAMRATATPTLRAFLIGILVPGSLLFCWLAAPKPDYLPVAQTDNVWGNFSTPPGGNIETIKAEMGPSWSSVCGRTTRARPSPRSSTTTSAPGAAATAAWWSRMPPIRARPRTWSSCCAPRSSRICRTCACMRARVRCSISTAAPRATSNCICKGRIWTR